MPELCLRFLETPLCGCTMNRGAAVQTVGLLNMQGKGGPVKQSHKSSTCVPSCCVSDLQFLVHNACSHEYVNEDARKTWEDTRVCLILALLDLERIDVSNQRCNLQIGPPGTVRVKKPCPPPVKAYVTGSPLKSSNNDSKKTRHLVALCQYFTFCKGNIATCRRVLHMVPNINQVRSSSTVYPWYTQLDL